MDKKILYLAVIVVVLVAAVGAVYVIYDEDEVGVPEDLASAELKVFGNIDGDRFIDNDDVKIIEKLISDGKDASEYPLADANQDGKIDQGDIDLVRKIIAGEDCVIHHINLYDEDQDGKMDMPTASTKFPIRSAIFHGTHNQAVFLFSLGIIDEIKGLSYNDLDEGLFKDFYLDESKFEHLEGGSMQIAFEDGKLGSSDLIKRENVTALIANWNKSEISNWKDFENAGVDVVRVAGGDIDRENLTHSAMIIGLLFQKTERANDYVDFNLKLLDYIDDKNRNAPVVKAVASSMNGRISSGESDYTGFIEAAGAEFGLKDLDFGTKSSIKIVEHPEVYTYEFDRIMHIRASIDYGSAYADVVADCKKMGSNFKDWKYADTGQYFVSGTMPPVFRVAYCACALFPDLVEIPEIDKFHQEYIDKFYNGLDIDASKVKLLLTPDDVKISS